MCPLIHRHWSNWFGQVVPKGNLWQSLKTWENMRPVKEQSPLEGTFGKLMQQFILGWAKFYDTFETQTNPAGGVPRSTKWTCFFGKTYVLPQRQIDLAIWFSCDFGRRMCGPIFSLRLWIYRSFVLERGRYEGKEWMGRNPEHFGQPSIPCA